LNDGKSQFSDNLGTLKYRAKFQQRTTPREKEEESEDSFRSDMEDFEDDPLSQMKNFNFEPQAPLLMPKQ